MKKEEPQIDLWMKEIAPDPELYKWFERDPEKWAEFKERYFWKLEEKVAELSQLRDLISKGRVTLVFVSKDEEFNTAVALKEFLNVA